MKLIDFFPSGKIKEIVAAPQVKFVVLEQKLKNSGYLPSELWRHLLPSGEEHRPYEGVGTDDQPFFKVINNHAA